MTFSPTVSQNHDPTVCHCCGRAATGIGIGNPGREDPRYLCGECVLLVERIREVRSWSPYELKAVDGGVDAVGEFIESIGGKTELSEFDEFEQRELVKAAWRGSVDRLRQILEHGEAPF
jgi:hypothetical protein